MGGVRNREDSDSQINLSKGLKARQELTGAKRTGIKDTICQGEKNLTGKEGKRGPKATSNPE